MFPLKLTKPYLKAATSVIPFDSRYHRLETTIVEIGLYGHRRLPKPDTMSDGLWEIIRCCWAYNPINRPAMEFVVGALAALQS